MSDSMSLRPDASDFRELFLRDTPMMDTRAPLEFSKGAFPHTVSLPLMTDQERAKVGTCYKKHGQDAAIKLGHQLVKGDIKDARVAQWLDFARTNPDGYLYCWRGGLRSQIVQQWLKEAGCEYPRITGGYKAMRRFLIDTLERRLNTHPLMILGGETGCAKTALLQQLDGAVDLEGLANHRGSTFGKKPDRQPPQIGFENALSVAFLRHEAFQPQRPVILEDESMLIGRCALPELLRQKMNDAPLVIIEADMESRVEHSFENYILNKLSEWQAALDGNEEAAFTAFADDLRTSLSKVEQRLGGLRYKNMTAQLEKAIDAHAAGNPDLHRDWIHGMLVEYYDPMYRWQLRKKEQRVVMRGPAAEVHEYLSQQFTDSHLP